MGILAGECGIGFDGANLAVQVKSGGAVVDAGTLRELQGVMANFGATRGQMVSWGEFTKTARAAARRLFFQIRFWASDDGIAKVTDVYMRLSLVVQGRSHETDLDVDGRGNQLEAHRPGRRRNQRGLLRSARARPRQRQATAANDDGANVGRAPGKPHRLVAWGPIYGLVGRRPGRVRNGIRLTGGAGPIERGQHDGHGLALLLLGFAPVGRLSPLQTPVDLMGARMPPLAHPVLEPR